MKKIKYAIAAALTIIGAPTAAFATEPVAYWSGGAIAVGLILVVATAVRVERKRRAALR